MLRPLGILALLRCLWIAGKIAGDRDGGYLRDDRVQRRELRVRRLEVVSNESRHRGRFGAPTTINPNFPFGAFDTYCNGGMYRVYCLEE
jgi:hypothetical protein